MTCLFYLLGAFPKNTQAGHEGRYELFRELRAGWTKKELMAHYALTEEQYERVLECLKVIGIVGSG